MKQYHTFLQKILKTGEKRENRTGINTIGIFGYQMRFSLQSGFPLVTTKKIHIKSVIHELLWMLQGSTNIKYLQEHGVRIWEEWADKNGELGPIYGHQWRSWPTSKKNNTIDQIQSVIQNIKKDPYSRRHIVTAWNPADIEKMTLPPCHILFQFYIVNNTLSCQMYQRSADAFLGVPFNIASYSLLTHLIARVCNLQVGDFIHTFGDAHIYENHIEQVKLQLSRTSYSLSKLVLKNKLNILEYTYQDIQFEDYQFHPHIPGKVAI